MSILLHSFKINSIYSFYPISHVIKVSSFKNFSHFSFNNEKAYGHKKFDIC